MLLRTIGNRMETIIMTSLVIITCVLILVGTAQVFFRYVVNYSLFWSEELMRYLFVWLVMLGIGIGVRQKAHVAVDALNYVLSPASQRWLNVINSVLGLAFFGILIWLGAKLAIKNMHQLSPAMNLPMGLVYLALPACGLISFFFYIEQVNSQFKNQE